jgi:hypothetical protein
MATSPLVSAGGTRENHSTWAVVVIHMFFVPCWDPDLRLAGLCLQIAFSVVSFPSRWYGPRLGVATNWLDELVQPLLAMQPSAKATASIGKIRYVLYADHLLW